MSLPWHHRWNVLALTLFSQALLTGIQTFGFAFWVVPWIDEFAVPRSELMLTVTLTTVVSGLLSPFAGIAIDRFSTRHLFAGGAAIYAGAMLLAAHTHSHWMIVFLFGGILSFGLVFCGPLCCQALIARWFVKDRGLALGISAAGISVGAFVAPPLITWLLPAYGWREAFEILALAILVTLVPAGWLILKRQSDSAGAAPSPHGVHGAMTGDEDRWTTATLLRNKDFLIIACSFACMVTAYFPLLYSVGSFAKDIGISQQHAAYGASLSALSLLIGKVLFGRLTDIYSDRRLFQIGVSLLWLGIVVTSLSKSYPPFLAGLMLVGFGQGCFVPMLSSMLFGRFGAASLGRAMGLAYIFTQISAIGPYIAGLVRDATGSYVVALLTLSTAILVPLIAMNWVSPLPAKTAAATPNSH